MGSSSFPCLLPAQNVTVEEILSAYKQACQKLNCKQIPKLLKQIQVEPGLSPPFPAGMRAQFPLWTTSPLWG